MLKTNRIFISMLALIVLCACSPANAPSGTDNTFPSPTPVSTAEVVGNKVITATDKSPVDEKSWSLIDEYPDAVKIDGVDFSVKLYIDAPVDERGDIVYDDGQQWALIVTDGTRYYTLLDKRIQLGEINFEVSDYYTETETISGITAIESTSTSFVLSRFELVGNTFVERIIYDTDDDSDAGINRRYSTIMK